MSYGKLVRTLGLGTSGALPTFTNGNIGSPATYKDALENLGQSITTLHSSLGAVATSNDYNDLKNKPSIPSAYTLPVATTSALGGVKVDGTTVTISNGVISAAAAYTLPTASTSVLGGVKVDGTTITITNGVISAAASGGAPTSTASITTWTGTPYDISGSCYGIPGASAVVARFIAPRALTVAAVSSTATAYADTVPTSAVTLTILKNGVTQIGTIVFASGSNTGTVTIASATSFNVGERLTVVAPAVADATFGDFEVVFAATLN